MPNLLQKPLPDQVQAMFPPEIGTLRHIRVLSRERLKALKNSTVTEGTVIKDAKEERQYQAWQDGKLVSKGTVIKDANEEPLYRCACVFRGWDAKNKIRFCKRNNKPINTRGGGKCNQRVSNSEARRHRAYCSNLMHLPIESDRAMFDVYSDRIGCLLTSEHIEPATCILCQNYLTRTRFQIHFHLQVVDTGDIAIPPIGHGKWFWGDAEGLRSKIGLSESQ